MEMVGAVLNLGEKDGDTERMGQRKSEEKVERRENVQREREGRRRDKERERERESRRRDKEREEERINRERERGIKRREREIE